MINYGGLEFTWTDNHAILSEPVYTSSRKWENTMFVKIEVHLFNVNSFCDA